MKSKKAFIAILAPTVLVAGLPAPTLAGVHDHCSLHSASDMYRDYSVLEVSSWLNKLAVQLEESPLYNAVKPNLLLTLPSQQNFFCSFQICKNGQIRNVSLTEFNGDQETEKRLIQAIESLDIASIGTPKNNLPFKRGVTFEIYNWGALYVSPRLDSQNYTDDQIAVKSPSKYAILNHINDGKELNIVLRASAK